MEVGPITAQPAGRRGRQATGLPAFAALLLASFSLAFSLAVVAAATSLGSDTDGPALGATPAGPNAAAARADIRLLALRAGHANTEFDTLAGHLQPVPAADAPGAFATPVTVGGAPAPAVVRDSQGRAPPRTR